MTAVQKTIAISTLLFEAMLLHILFCNWNTGAVHQYSVDQWVSRTPDLSGLIVSFGPAGIYARSYQTFEFDVVLGIGFPAAFMLRRYSSAL